MEFYTPTPHFESWLRSKKKKKKKHNVKYIMIIR